MTVEIEYSHNRYIPLFEKPKSVVSPVVYVRRSSGNTHILFGYTIDNVCVDWMVDCELESILRRWPLASYIE